MKELIVQHSNNGFSAEVVGEIVRCKDCKHYVDVDSRDPAINARYNYCTHQHCIHPKRKDHKLDEWHDFCDWIRYLPYSELITLDGV